MVVSIRDLLYDEKDTSESFEFAMERVRTAHCDVYRESPMITAFRVALRMELYWHVFTTWASAMKNNWSHKVKRCEYGMRMLGISEKRVARFRRVQQDLGSAL
jgi:hypothetical protein